MLVLTQRNQKVNFNIKVPITLHSESKLTRFYENHNLWLSNVTMKIFYLYQKNDDKAMIYDE